MLVVLNAVDALLISVGFERHAPNLDQMDRGV